MTPEPSSLLRALISEEEGNSVAPSRAKSGDVERLLAEAEADVHELTKALTGLTCNGSEFFVEKRGRHVADAAACVEYVKRRNTANHNLIVESVRRANRAEDALRKIAEGLTPPDEHGHYLAHREAVRIAREALRSPASQPSPAQARDGSRTIPPKDNLNAE